MGFSGLQKDRSDSLRIAGIRHSERHVETDVPIVQGEVRYALLDEFGIGDDDRHVVVRSDLRCPGSDRDDFALDGVALERPHLHAVTHLHGLLQQQEQARCEVLGDGPESQPQSNSEGAVEYGNASEVHPACMDAGQNVEDEQRVGDDPLQGELAPFVEGGRSRNCLLTNLPASLDPNQRRITRRRVAP